MKELLYRIKRRLLTNHYLRKYHIKKSQGIIIENGFKVYDKCHVTLKDGVHICKNVVFSGGGTIVIGKKSTIFNGCELHALSNSSITIGDDCLIAKGAYIINSNHSFSKDNLIRKQQPVSGNISIGNDVWIGGYVMILKGVSIGDGSVIGAGSVVNKNIASFKVACGVPCKEIKNRE